MSPGRFEAMLGGIVAFEMTVERLEGVNKLSQNKSTDAARRVAAALSELDDVSAQAIARRMVSRLETD
jgi:predicted FMN-binding regulatory protein PaiB